MKFCSRFYEYFYVEDYEGNIRLCPWMERDKAAIGNLMTEDIEEMYNSDYVNYLRSTMDDQSFRYCRMEACPHLQNRNLENITPEEYEKRKKTKYYPSIINMAYDFICNQFCETCRKTMFVPPANYSEQMSAIRSKLAPYLETAKQITASGRGDPFASKYMMEVLEDLKPANPDLSILLETNGVFFDETRWERIEHLSNVNLSLVVTINSFDEFTYNHVSCGGDYKKMLRNLDFMSQLRKNGDLKDIANCLVIQDRNFREIPSFIKRSFADYAFDTVILKPVYHWRPMDDDVYWFKDVLNPCHPYHSEYLEVMRDQTLKDTRVYHLGGDTVHVARPFPGSGV